MYIVINLIYLEVLGVFVKLFLVTFRHTRSRNLKRNILQKTSCQTGRQMHKLHFQMNVLSSLLSLCGNLICKWYAVCGMVCLIMHTHTHRHRDVVSEFSTYTHTLIGLFTVTCNMWGRGKESIKILASTFFSTKQVLKSKSDKLNNCGMKNLIIL